MTTSEIINAISNIGFPAVFCLMLFYFNKVEIEKLRTIIDNNTKILSDLKTLIDKLT